MKLTKELEVDDIKDIRPSDVLIIERKQDKRKILVKCISVVNDGEVLLSKARNDYFIFSMVLSGESWVSRVWNIGQVEITNITNTMKDFPRS